MNIQNKEVVWNIRCKTNLETTNDHSKIQSFSFELFIEVNWVNEDTLADE